MNGPVPLDVHAATAILYTLKGFNVEIPIDVVLVKRNTCSVNELLKDTLYPMMTPFCSNTGGGFHKNEADEEVVDTDWRLRGELEGSKKRLQFRKFFIIQKAADIAFTVFISS